MEKEQERQIFTLNDQNFYTDSVSEDGIKLINSISTIQAEIQEYSKEIQKAQLRTEIAVVAKDAIIGKLESIVDTFEEAPKTETEPTK